MEGTVVGYEVGDNCFTVLFTIGEVFQTFKIVLDILVEFLECTDEEVEYTLQQNLPFSCRQQMLNIAKLKNSKSNKSYTLPLKARVVGTMHYQVDGGEKKE